MCFEVLCVGFWGTTLPQKTGKKFLSTQEFCAEEISLIKIEYQDFVHVQGC